MRCVNQKELYLDVAGVSTLVSVPCGKCIPCLVNKRSDWCFRLEREHRVSKSAMFVTLTYDEKHLRTNGSLDKRDLQLFLKRLRRRDESSRIRYYAVGEYGSRFGRPHYHLLLFNSVESDVRMAWLDSRGVPIGAVHVGLVSSASIAYVTKYMIQKDDYPDGVEKPFATMSRRYGIGGHYLTDQMVAWHRLNDANYVVRVGNEKGRLPRFYRDKIWYSEYDRGRISAAALALTKANEEKENSYYMLEYGDRWAEYKCKALELVLNRVKQKVKFTQTF
ncbi:replication initiator protein [Blackfly microvirus SF02]|uniref:Replication initiator protein n=1 Tax=Blackfly microvirus SF02 TaxID=2576452 RepID=A0A4V1F5H3_9VIRU|nr:replication initiator protein [Blackfly microvirus SF02]